MKEIQATAARGRWSTVLSGTKHRHERWRLLRHGHPVGALVPDEDLALLEAIDELRDARDLPKVMDALQDPTNQLRTPIAEVMGRKRTR